MSGPSNQEIPSAVQYRSLSERLDAIDEKIADAPVLPEYQWPDAPEPPSAGAVPYVTDFSTGAILAIFDDGTVVTVTEKNPK